MDKTTIAAIATPIGSAGVGIIKISGPRALEIAGTLFKKSGLGGPPPSWESHRLLHGYIHDRGRVIDEVLAVAMIAPRSYTGEDVVEIQAHSGYAVLGTILELVLKRGARLAHPGEFTKRAFMNGRLDLTQAEGVIDVINARTEKALGVAASQAGGRMRKRIGSIKEKLIKILSGIEGAIDFPEDVEEMEAREMAEAIENEAIKDINTLIETYDSAHFLRDGLRVAVVGKPNAGKSSLMNALVRKDISIVTEIPGTTRDLIREPMNIRGVPLTIADTAGLRETDDPVENIGIERTRRFISGADIALFLLDAGKPLDKEDHRIYPTLKGKRVIIVVNKSDLDRKKEFTLPEGWEKNPAVRISALYHRGIDGLLKLMGDICLDKLPESNEGVIPNLRHKKALESCRNSLLLATRGLKEEAPFELIAIDINEALTALNEITGDGLRPDILDEIFNRFCIGK